MFFLCCPQAQLEQAIAGCDKIRTADATVIILALGASNMTEGFKGAISEAISQKTSGAVVSTSDKGQICHAIEAFPSKSMWMRLFDPNMMDRHIPSMAHLMERMGLSHANEDTFAYAIAIICLARMESTHQKVYCPQQAFKMLMQLKKLVRCLCKKGRQPHTNKIKNWRL